jgi:methionyl-tRNA formyltransferase
VLTIACGHDLIRPSVVQRQGKKPMAVADLLRGFDIPRGSQLDLPAEG